MHAARSLPAALAAALLVLGCDTPAFAERVTGSGTSATQSRDIAQVRSVGLSVPGTLDIVQGDRESLSVTGDDNVLPLVETAVEQGALRIRFRESRSLSVTPKVPLRFTLQVRALEGIAIAGSGDVRAERLDVPKLHVSVSGSGNALLGGKVQSLDVDVAGSGNVKASKLEASRATVSIAGSGDARLWVREAISASIAGSGNVDYFGDPKASTSIAGSGRVRRLAASPG